MDDKSSEKVLRVACLLELALHGFENSTSTARCEAMSASGWVSKAELSLRLNTRIISNEKKNVWILIKRES